MGLAREQERALEVVEEQERAPGAGELGPGQELGLQVEKAQRLGSG